MQKLISVALDVPINQLFDNITYASISTGVQPDYSEPFLDAEHHPQITNKVIIQRINIYFENDVFRKKE